MTISKYSSFSMTLFSAQMSPTDVPGGWSNAPPTLLDRKKGLDSSDVLGSMHTYQHEWREWDQILFNLEHEDYMWNLQTCDKKIILSGCVPCISKLRYESPITLQYNCKQSLINDYVGVHLHSGNTVVIWQPSEWVREWVGVVSLSVCSLSLWLSDWVIESVIVLV